KNILACKLATEATANYRAYLLAQAAKVKDANKAVETKLKVAENTYRTMTLSVGVAELIRQGQLDLQAVMSMDLPQLRGFDNAARAVRKAERAAEEIARETRRQSDKLHVDALSLRLSLLMMRAWTSPR